MTVNGNRTSTYTAASGGSDGRNGEKNLWNSLLNSVASGKRLPEKNIIVLGGNSESQKEFLESLSNSSEKRSLDRQSSKAPPVANSFALGYTYYDVLDADQEDTLARISLYMLSNPSEAFPRLLEPLITPESIPNTLMVILLDWSTPHLWLRQMRKWILFMRNVLEKTNNECQAVMEDVMVSWRDRGRGGGSTNVDGTGATSTGDGDVALPLGPGEWEEALGLPLCVVCQNAEKIELLEKSQGWKEGDFDQVLQYMRTTLLRHGASLIYTTPNVPSPLPSLVHSSLGITSLLKRQPLKHNVIDRDKILVPPNWDSWGKIRVLREGFDVEATSIGWSRDLHSNFTSPAMTTEGLNVLAKARAEGSYEGEQWSSAVAPYEDWIRDLTSTSEALALGGRDASSTELEVTSQNTQDFLAASLASLEVYKSKAEQKTDSQKGTAARTGRRSDEVDASSTARATTDGKVSEHIGPVQFNMGGIQVDADDMVQRLKDRQAYSSPPDSGSPGESSEKPGAVDTENLQAFFSGLMNRKGGATNSPRTAS